MNFGLAHLSALNLAPAEFIRVAAEIGYSSVGIRLVAVNDTTPGYALMDDPKQLRDTLRTLVESGIYVNDVEFIKFTPETDPHGLTPLIDTAAELGARHIIVAPYDEDLSRMGDNMADFTNRAKSVGVGVSLEFFPWTVISDLRSCFNFVTAHSDDLTILVDPLHFNRSNSSLDLLSTIPRERLPFAQFCDAPVRASYTYDELIYAGRDERLAPGLGEIPLKKIFEALPNNTPISLEVPQLKLCHEKGERVALENLFQQTQEFFAST